MRQWFFLTIVVLTATAVGAAELSETLDTIEAAYGGQDAIDRLQSYRLEGETTSLTSGLIAEVVRQYQGPDFLRVEVSYPNRTEVRLVTPEGVWRGSSKEIHRAEGPLKEAVLYQLLRSELPGVLLRNRSRLEDEGEVDRDGEPFRVIVLRWSPSLVMRYWCHRESSRITWVEGTIAAGEQRLVFATGFSNFRRVDGVLFPYSEKNYASGRHVADTKVTSVWLGPSELRASKFLLERLASTGLPFE